MSYYEETLTKWHWKDNSICVKNILTTCSRKEQMPEVLQCQVTSSTGRGWQTRWCESQINWGRTSNRSFREGPVEFSRPAHEALSILHYVTWAGESCSLLGLSQAGELHVGTFPGRSSRRCSTDLGGISPTHQKGPGTEKPRGAQIAFCAARVSHLLFLTVSWKHLGKAI